MTSHLFALVGLVVLVGACHGDAPPRAAPEPIAHRDYRIDEDGGGFLGSRTGYLLVGVSERPYLRNDGVMDFGMSALLVVIDEPERIEFDVRLGTRVAVRGEAFHCVEIDPGLPDPPGYQFNVKKGGTGFIVMRRWADSR